MAFLGLIFQKSSKIPIGDFCDYLDITCLLSHGTSGHTELVRLREINRIENMYYFDWKYGSL